MFECQALDADYSDEDEETEEKPNVDVPLKDLVGSIG